MTVFDRAITGLSEEYGDPEGRLLLERFISDAHSAEAEDDICVELQIGSTGTSVGDESVKVVPAQIVQIRVSDLMVMLGMMAYKEHIEDDLRTIEHDLPHDASRGERETVARLAQGIRSLFSPYRYRLFSDGSAPRVYQSDADRNEKYDAVLKAEMTKKGSANS